MDGMDTNTFRHLSAFIGSRPIGLGWLAGISVMETDRAVTTDWHSHATAEMLFCLRGETHYEFRDRPALTLCAGAFLVIPAHIEHRVSNAIDEPGKRLGLNLRETDEKPSRFALFAAADYRRLFRQLNATAFIPRPCTPDMRRSILELDRLVHVPRLPSFDCGRLRLLCCSILYDTAVPTQGRIQPSVKIMDEAVLWLEQHAHEKLGIDRLVAFMGYSRARLFTLFRTHTGLTPNDYLLRIRLKRAKEKLASSSASVQSIATACGFADNGYFARVFKRQTGFTPLDYRRHFHDVNN